MMTKAKGDIAEQAVVLECLKRGWEVLKPIGDKKPYDLVADVDGTLVKIQVKAAWFSESTKNFVVDNRRTKTNRRSMLRSTYSLADFDFAVVSISELHLFYVFPGVEFLAYASEIHLVEQEKRQRKPRSAPFREAWNLISKWVKTQRYATTISGMRSLSPAS